MYADLAGQRGDSSAQGAALGAIGESSGLGELEMTIGGLISGGSRFAKELRAMSPAERAIHHPNSANVSADTRVSRLLGESCATQSFSANTTVAVAGGQSPISEVRVGDQVTALDPDTGEVDQHTVMAVDVHSDPEIEFLRVDGETIETTPDHRFLTDHGWVEAAALYPGARVVKLDGTTGTVEGYSIEVRSVIMWDLTVSDVHTFAVGQGQWVVHNACGGGESAAAAAGRKAHKDQDYGPGFDKEFTLPSGLRPDAINFDLGVVVELKPGNWTAIRRGLRQVSKYLDEMDLKFPRDTPWSGQVTTY